MKQAKGMLALSFIIIFAATTCQNGHTLNILPHPQETESWCWAASGQMVMHFLGRDVSQCTQANDSFNRTDCPCTQCTNAAANPPCVATGWPNLGKYGFSFQRTSGVALTWAQLKNELDLGRPIAFSWHWAGDGGHMMVAVGYRVVDGAPYVEVRDPGPPCAGDYLTMTYGAYQSGTDYTHWDDFYGIHR